MIERNGSSEQIPEHQHIDIYTPKNISNLGYDSQLQDALFLLRQGVHELRDVNGPESVAEWQADYTLTTRAAPDTTKIALWEQEQEQAQKRDPFLLVAWNTKDGVVGAIEGRKYTYAGTGDNAIFINWVVVRDTGSSDDDKSTRRRKNVASSMYDILEVRAREHDVKLLIAGVNAANPASAAFHEKKGFRNEQFSGQLTENGPLRPYATENGAFIPAYPITRLDAQGNQIAGVINFYTKRLP